MTLEEILLSIPDGFVMEEVDWGQDVGKEILEYKSDEQ